MANSVRRVEYFDAIVDDRPGEAYRLLKHIAAAKVNLLAFTVIPLGVERTQIVLFPESEAGLARAAEDLGVVLKGPHRAFLIQGDDELGALVELHRVLSDGHVNVMSSIGVTDGRGGYGYILHVRAQDYEESQINVFNEFWIPVTPLMEALEVGVWLRAPTSGQQVRLLIDARDIYKTPVNAQRSQIHGFVNFFQGYSAGATSVRVCMPTGTAGHMGWVGWNGGGDDYLMVPRKITRSNSWGCGTEIFGFHRNTMVETAIQIDSSGMGATSYDTMILCDGLPYGVSTRDWMGIGHGGYTYRTWPSASVTVSSKWTRYTIVLRGENSPLRRYCTVDGQNEYTTLYPGTSQVRFGIGANYGGVNGPLYVNQFVVRRRNYQPLSECPRSAGRVRRRRMDAYA